MSQQKLVHSDCWCYAAKRQVRIKGRIEGERQASLLRITHCEIDTMCQKRGQRDCLIGKLREGRW